MSVAKAVAHSFNDLLAFTFVFSVFSVVIKNLKRLPCGRRKRNELASMQARLAQAQCRHSAIYSKDALMRLLRRIIALISLALLTTLAAAEGPASPQELCDSADYGEMRTMQFEEAAYAIQFGLDYRAILCTSAGAIYVDLYENLTPKTVNNFVFLAEQGYYDSTTFHRVIPNFMAQGGDPTGTGRGGPGYQFDDEPVSYLTFDRPGLLAMANAGPGTNGSQFFITTAPTPHLNFKHTIFGDVLLGQDVVYAIRERDPGSASEPGESLHTVLVITDHSLVDNSDVIEMQPATQEQVVAAFEALAGGLPDVLSIADDSGLLSADALAATMPGDLQEAYAEYAENYGLEYRYRLNLLNRDCDEAVYFSSLGYQVDVFESEEAAGDALFDSFNRDLFESMGFDDQDRLVTFSKQAPTCDEKYGVHMVTLNAQGRFLVTIDMLVELDRLAGMPGASDLLQRFAFGIEPALTALYLPEIR